MEASNSRESEPLLRSHSFWKERAWSLLTTRLWTVKCNLILRVGSQAGASRSIASSICGHSLSVRYAPVVSRSKAGARIVWRLGVESVRRRLEGRSTRGTTFELSSRSSSPVRSMTIGCRVPIFTNGRSLARSRCGFGGEKRNANNYKGSNSSPLKVEPKAILV